MLEARQFVPVAFDIRLIGSDLTKSVGRLAARLLAAHGDAIDDDMGFQIPRRSATGGVLQLAFRDRGLLTVMSLWARFEGSYPEEMGPESSAAREQMEWAVELLMSIMTAQKAKVMALTFESTWLLREQTSTAPLVAHVGLSHALGGLFAGSEDFNVRGDMATALPGLFPVTCEVRAGRLGVFEPPENVGVQIKHRSPDNHLDLGTPIDFTRGTVDRFFTASPLLMEQQLARFFPPRGAT